MDRSNDVMRGRPYWVIVRIDIRAVLHGDWSRQRWRALWFNLLR